MNTQLLIGQWWIRDLRYIRIWNDILHLTIVASACNEKSFAFACAVFSLPSCWCLRNGLKKVFLPIFHQSLSTKFITRIGFINMNDRVLSNHFLQRWKVITDLNKSMWILLFNHQNDNIFTVTMFMATKLGRVMTYHEGLPPTKSNDPLSMWSWEIMWQTKNIMEYDTECLWPPNLAGC